MVTCSKLPPGTNRTSAPLGRRSPSPGMARPVLVAVLKPQEPSETVSGLMPRARSAREMLRPCHFLRSQNRTTSVAILLRGEGAGQDRRVDVAGLEALARFERRDGHLGRAEQH